ncbi:MAG TPA: hypothetical protein VG103_13230 [Chthoniobacterales bacterium]|jgi:hypothetical protein|nr:hypothetical protein [Chthoniobacterales bacterium]
MKRISTFMSIFAVSAVISARADDLPAKFSFDRYKGLVEHSPFAVATAVVAPEATPNFAKDLYVANAARSPDGDMATIASMADRDFKKYLTTRMPVDGYSIASIEWSDRVGETKVTISKDGQFATLTFNQAAVSQPTSTRLMPGILPPNPQQPSMQQPSFGPRPGAPNSFTTPTPHVRGMIQRNPQVQTPPSSSDQ